MRIKNLTINGTLIDLKQMVLIVGSNNTGKTTLLNELYAHVSGRSKDSTFWNLGATDYEFDINDNKTWTDTLIERQEQRRQQITSYFYCPFTENNNTPDGIEISAEQYSQIKDKPNQEFFNDGNILRKELIHHLSVDKRLMIQPEGQMINALEKSSNIPDLLNRHPEIVKSINKMLEKLFLKILTVCTHVVPKIELRISEKNIKQLPNMDFNDRITSVKIYSDWLKENNIANIQREGHGIRAFLHIMLTYFKPTNQILMIDEPEIHLYPSVKRKFGNEVGKLAKTNGKQIFCVTHDSDFFQGVINSGCEITVIRLSKSIQERTISVVQYGMDNTRLTANQKDDNFAQIPFLDCIVLVEGAADRLVYEHVFSSLNLLDNLEYKFISAYGADRVSNAEYIAKEFCVPCAIILDFDTLRKKGKKPPLVTKLSNLGNECGLYLICNENVLNDKDYPRVELRVNDASVVEYCYLESQDAIKNWYKLSLEDNTLSKIKKILSNKTGTLDGYLLDDLKQCLEKIIQTATSNKHQALPKQINIIADQLKGIPDIDSKGIDAINDPSLKKDVNNIIEKLKQYHIFVVPVGNLESWKDIDCIKTHYPEEFIAAYDKTSSADLENFLNKVGKDLLVQINKISVT